MDDTHNKIYNFHIIDNKSPIYDTYCEIINDLESDKSIFITGHAGSGKSTMLRNVMKYFYDKKIPYEKCAYTGIAAWNIEGRTINSLFSIDPNKISKMDDQKLNDHYTRFANIKLLFIDEISIVPTFYLERIDSILKKAKQDDKKPFGGVTMVFCGDFLQLSPIVDTNQIRTYFQNEGIEMNVKTKWAFTSIAWNSIKNLKIYKLNKNLRFDVSDSLRCDFVECLSDIRVGKCSNKVMQLLNKIKNTHNENFPCLTTFKEDARRINDEKFDRLNGKIFMMKAVYERFEEQKLNKNSLPLDMEMKYKIGERVIILANKFNAFINDYEYYNGSIGVIENYFIDPDCIEKSKCDVRLDNGNEVTVDYKEWKQTRYRLNNYGEYEEIIIGVFKQMPLLPAYAMTIHRCQGMTLDGINLINPNSAFADGQLYVALSRVKDFNNIYSNEQIDINSFKVCPYVLEYFKDYENVFLFSRENDKDLTTYIIYFHDENIECIRKYPKNAPYHRFNQNYFEYVSMDSYEYNDIVNAINDMKKNSSNILKNINYVKILEYNNDNIWILKNDKDIKFCEKLKNTLLNDMLFFEHKKTKHCIERFKDRDDGITYNKWSSKIRSRKSLLSDYELIFSKIMLNKKETHINNKETYIKVENVESPETCWRQIEFLLKNILNQNEYLNFEKGFNVKLIDDAFIKGFINIQEQRLCHKIRMDGNKNRHIQGSNIKYNSEEYMSIRELIKKLTNIISVQKTGTRIN